MPQDNHEIIHSQQTNQSPGKLAPNIPVPIVGDITFKNDFGDTAVGLAHFTQDQGIITILTLAGAFIGSAFGGFPMAGAILLAGLNDIRYAGKQDDKAPPVLSTAIQQPTSLSAPESPPTYPSEVQPMPVNYQQVVERPAPVSQIQATPTRSVRSAFTLVLANPFQSLAVFGAQRTGKSYMMAILSQELHRRGIPIYAINLAAYGKEDDVYWSHCNKVVMGDISEMRPYDANQLIEQAITIVEEFYSRKEAILIIDEWAYTGGKNNAHAEALEPLLKLIADKLSILTSTGIKRGRAIWTIAPECVAKDLQDPALAIKKSKLLYVTIPPGKSVDWNGNEIKFDDQLFRQVKANYAVEYPEGRFTNDRICYLNKEWIEMGDLPPLDPTLRPVSTPVATTPPPLPDARQSYTDEEKRQAETNMVAALRTTSHNTLWEFARDELGVSISEEIKKVLTGIADVIFDYELTELKNKFRLSSKNDVRYSYRDYSKRVWETHQYTGNICCCCKVKPSEEVHHSRYQGENDKAGVNLYPVCGGRGKNGCHDKLCHSFENWVIDREDLWGSHATPEWEAKLKEAFELLAQGKQ